MKFSKRIAGVVLQKIYVYTLAAVRYVLAHILFVRQFVAVGCLQIGMYDVCGGGGSGGRGVVGALCLLCEIVCDYCFVF